MNVFRFRTGAIVTAVISIVAVVAAGGCAEDALDVGSGPVSAEASAPSFTPDDAAADAPPAFALCPATTCPPGRATCPSPSGGDVQKCDTQLLSDRLNCGACGAKCADLRDEVGQPRAPLHYVLECLQGKCVSVCASPIWKDCNGIAEDGCETSLETPSNCGACGNACAPGVACIAGKCGCPAGQTQCTVDGTPQCVDLKSDDGNCGACNKPCPIDPSWLVPPNMHYGCVNATCGASGLSTPPVGAPPPALPMAPPKAQLKCDSFGAGATFANCNANLADGCEVNVRAAGDDKNCGACGKVCPAGTKCSDFSGSGLPQCECSAGKTHCGLPGPGGESCADLTSDLQNCGSCGNKCPGSTTADIQGANVTISPVCKNGQCDYECAAGRADCNGRKSDGCEVDLRSSAANCGACGHRCNTAIGQPCIEGVCMMTTCDGGTTR